MKGFLSRALQGVVVGALVGSIVGIVRAAMSIWENSYIDYGLNHLAAKVFSSEVLVYTAYGAFTVVAAIMVGLLAYPVARLLRRNWPRALGGALAAPIILALFVGVGYYVNRNYLPGIYQLTSILANIGMGLVAILLWFGLARIFDHVAAARLTGTLLRGASLAAVPLVVVCLALGQFALWFFPPSPVSESRPNVLVIMIDALRADRLGAYGYARDTSPNIDKLAADGIVYTHASTHAPWTKPSVASLFSSMYPRQHGIGSSDWTYGDREGGLTVDVLGRKVLTVAELLSNAGYQTVAIGENNHLTHKTGFDQGFDSYVMTLDPDEHWTRAPEMNERFLSWLESNGDEDFFAYLHYIDVHWPYLTPPPYQGMYAGPPSKVDYNRLGFVPEHNEAPPTDFDPEVLQHMNDAYDEGIRFIDDKIGEILDALKKRNLYDSALIIVVADHGEEFLDHGGLAHGTSLYDELVRVPLIVKFPCPGSNCGSKVIEEQVELIDVMPTITSSAGISLPVGLFGRNLASENTEPEKAGFSERADKIALRTPTHKFIYSLESDDEELYDLVVDPEETRNLIDEQPELADDFRRRVFNWIELVDSGLSVKSGRTQLDDDSKKRLEALGYVE